MIDIVKEIEAVQRQVSEGRIAGAGAHTIRLTRTYEAAIEDVWDALTSPDRIRRWFLPISGDYRIGGRFQFEGNAGGDIVDCARPNRLRVTWGFGQMPDGSDGSELEVRLTTAGEGSTALELEHTAIVPEEMWDQFGPGAVGVGWEQGLFGLALHLLGGTVGDPIAWQQSDEGRDYATRSSQAWGEASAAAGVDPERVASNVAATTAFYTTAPEPGAGD